MSEEEFEKISEKISIKENILIVLMREFAEQKGARKVSCGAGNCKKKVVVIVSVSDGDNAEIHFLCWEHFGKVMKQKGKPKIAPKNP